MPNILDILARAQSLMNETALNSITPPRAGGIMYDTLLVLNQMQLEGGSLLISKIYTSVSAMEADTTPTSDLTGRALRAGQLAVIVPADTSSADLGKVYRFNSAGSWSLCGKIGGLPFDTEPADGSTNGITSGAVYDVKQALEGEVSRLDIKVDGINDQYDTSILTDNAYISANDGAIVANSYRSYSDYIPVTPGAVITFKVYGAASAEGYAFYDSAKNYVSGVGYNGGNAVLVSIIVPSGVSYIRTTWYKSTNANYSSFSFKQTMDGMEDRLEDLEDLEDIVPQLEEDVADASNKADYAVDVTPATRITQSNFSLSGIYKTTDDTIGANANYHSSALVSVTPGQVVEWKNFPVMNDDSFVLCCYDANNDPVSVGANNRVKYGTIKNTLKYTIPTGIYKVGFTWNDGTYPLTSASVAQIGNDVYSITDDAVQEIGTKLGIDTISGDLAILDGEVGSIADELDYILEYTAPTTKEQGDFTTIGLYKQAAAEVDASYTNYRAIALVNVVEGQTIKWHDWQKGAENTIGQVAAIFLYDNDGLPYNGTDARIDYHSLTTKDYETGEYTFVIPSNCSQIGLSYNFTAYPVGDNESLEISGAKYEFTDEAKEMINNAVEGGHDVGDDSAKYYLKGNSNIVYSPSKKLGIIAAGQSNIDGRNSYEDLPASFVNPNSKVKFCDNVNGTFSSFEVTDGGQGNDWSFDAIVYDALTNPSYGNQSEIFVMKHSMGGTSIDPLGATEYHWTADYEFLDSPSHSLLRTFETIVRKGVELQGANFDIKAMLWHQGEGDMQNESVANRYYDNLKNMLAYVRGVIGNPRLYFFCGNISLHRTTPGYVNIINAAYTKLASEDPYFKVVDMSNAQLEDGYHFDYKWSIYFGQKVYDLMVDAGIITGTKINPSEPE